MINYGAMVARVSDSTLYVAGRGVGLVTFDISNLSNPSLLDVLQTHDALDVKLVGPYAFVADGGWGAGVKIVDVSDPSSMKTTGQASTPGVAECVEPVGEYFYVADWSRGLSVLKVRFPQEPTIVGSVPSSGRGTDVVIRDGYAFVADEVAGLRVIDVSLPDAPCSVGTSATPFNGCSVAISGSYAYVGWNVGDGVFRVLDISSPSSPKVVGSCTENWGCNGVAVSGAYVYAAGWNGGLRVIDVSNPSAPQIVGLCVPSFTIVAKDVAVSGSYAYVAYETDLVVIDISNPTLPTLAGSMNIPGMDAVGVDGQRILCIYCGRKLRPADLRCLGSHESNPSWQRISCSGRDQCGCERSLRFCEDTGINCM